MLAKEVYSVDCRVLMEKIQLGLLLPLASY